MLSSILLRLPAMVPSLLFSFIAFVIIRLPCEVFITSYTAPHKRELVITTVLAFNFIGGGLRDAADPYTT